MFGRADLKPGSSAYGEAVELGHLLAAAGFRVVCGGYEGAMEAVSRGAVEGGGEAEGVVCRAFPLRAPNPFLTTTIWADDLLRRTALLLDRSDACVALDPRAGTLAEVANLWALEKAGTLPPRPLALVGEAWEEILRVLERLGTAEGNLLQSCICVPGPRQAVEAIQGMKEREFLRHG